jgi:hypothetical protein
MLTREQVEYEPRLNLLLKGVAEPVNAYVALRLKGSS